MRDLCLVSVTSGECVIFVGVGNQRIVRDLCFVSVTSRVSGAEQEQAIIIPALESQSQGSRRDQKIKRS